MFSEKASAIASMRQKCVRNASKWVLFDWGKEERSKMSQKCVKIASKMRGTPLGGEHLLDATELYTPHPKKGIFGGGGGGKNFWLVGKLPEKGQLPEVVGRGHSCRSFGPVANKSLLQNGVPLVQKRFWTVRKTLGRPSLPGSKKPYAPSP